jgi:hypothetical protein
MVASATPAPTSALAASTTAMPGSGAKLPYTSRPPAIVPNSAGVTTVAAAGSRTLRTGSRQRQAAKAIPSIASGQTASSKSPLV